MKFRTLFVILILTLALAACQNNISSTAPAPTPASTPASAPGNFGHGASSSREALAACDLPKQEQVFIADQLPDWDSVGIDTCYDLRFDLADGGGAYTGSARITFTNLENTAMNDLVLRLIPNSIFMYGGSLQIDSARLGEQILQQESMLDDGTAVRLPLPQSIQPEETVLLDLTFSGRLPVDLDGRWTHGIFNLDSSGPTAVLSKSYPMLALRQDGKWAADPVLPYVGSNDNKPALHLVEIHTPEGWKTAETGIQLEHSRKDNQEVYKIASGLVVEFLWAASPSFKKHHKVSDGTRLQHWGPAKTLIPWQTALRMGKESLELFNPTFGSYPFRELDVVVVQLGEAGGMAYPGIILIDKRVYNASDSTWLSILVSHEISHQWWGDLVANDIVHAPWQMESLAEFSHLLYLARYNPTAYQNNQSSITRDVNGIEKKYGKLEVAQPFTSFADVNAYSAARSKGALFFEALREQIGEEAFFNGLRGYYAANKYKIATEDDLLDSFEAACACDLTGIYDEWGVR